MNRHKCLRFSPPTHHCCIIVIPGYEKEKLRGSTIWILFIFPSRISVDMLLDPKLGKEEFLGCISILSERINNFYELKHFYNSTKKLYKKKHLFVTEQRRFHGLGWHTSWEKNSRNCILNSTKKNDKKNGEDFFDSISTLSEKINNFYELKHLYNQKKLYKEIFLCNRTEAFSWVGSTHFLRGEFKKLHFKFHEEWWQKEMGKILRQYSHSVLANQQLL